MSNQSSESSQATKWSTNRHVQLWLWLHRHLLHSSSSSKWNVRSLTKDTRQSTKSTHWKNTHLTRYDLFESFDSQKLKASVVFMVNWVRFRNWLVSKAITVKVSKVIMITIRWLRSNSDWPLVYKLSEVVNCSHNKKWNSK